jgi:hypothetical protein
VADGGEGLVPQGRYLQRPQHRPISLVGLYTGRQDATTLRASNSLVKSRACSICALPGRNSKHT